MVAPISPLISDNTHLYTRDTQLAIKRVAYTYARQIGNHTDIDDLFFAGEYRVAKSLARFDPSKWEGKPFERWACAQAYWGMKDHVAETDLIPRRMREQGVDLNPYVYLDALEPWQAENLGGTVAFDDRMADREDRENMLFLLDCMEELSPEHNRVLKLAYWHGYNQGEIGELIGCTGSNVGQIINYTILPKLRTAIRRRANPIKPIVITPLIKVDPEPARLEGLRKAVCKDLSVTPLRAAKLSALTLAGFRAVAFSRVYPFSHPSLSRCVKLDEAYRLAKDILLDMSMMSANL